MTGPSGWLPNEIGPVVIRVEGVEQIARGEIDFVGFTGTDDPENDKLVLEPNVEGVVTSVSGSAPIVSTGGTTPELSITPATTGAAGSLSAADKTKLDSLTSGAAVASVSGSAPIVSSGGATPAISITAATTGAAGSMSAADKTKLDGIQKQGGSVAIALLSIDWSLGGTFSKTLAAGANTFTFANATDGQVIVVVVTGAASTLTWPTVKWAAGAAPTQTASGIDVYTFVKVGSTIYGSVVQAMA